MIRTHPPLGPRAIACKAAEAPELETPSPIGDAGPAGLRIVSSPPAVIPALGDDPRDPGRSVSELMRLRFDPVACAEATFARNARAPIGEARLRMSTLNAGLLDTAALLRLGPRLLERAVRPIAGPVAPVAPHLVERRAALAERVLARNDDVVVLQEIWTETDLRAIVSAAERRGYLAIATPRPGTTDGLLTLIKRSAIDRSAPIEHRSAPFSASHWLARIFTTIRQGYQIVSFTHPKIGRIHVVNSHLPPGDQNWRLRLLDARELGIAARGAGDGLLLVGGDLNAPALPPKGQPADARSLAAHAALAHYAELDDLVSAGLGADAPASFDPTNPLNVLQGNDRDRPERLDHLLGRGPLRVMRTEMSFNGSLPGEYPLSDHYGFSVELAVRPKLTRRRSA